MNKAASFAHSAFPGEGSATGRAGSRKPWPAMVAGLLWLAAGLSAGYWVLLAWGRSPAAAVPALVAAPPVADVATVALALGSMPVVSPVQVADAPVAAASRYILKGVVAVGTDQGAALIAVDGQPPRPYRVGAALDGGLVLQAVTRLEVRLGPAADGPTTVTLSLPDIQSGGR